MATLNSKRFSTLVGDFAAAVQGSSRQLVDFTIGSILRAVAEASSGVALWLQGLAFQILTTTRLATSVGSDADSFVNDFGLTRIPAVAATGIVTFSRVSSVGALQAVIPVGAKVNTTDGSQPFLVYADTTNSSYSATAVAGGGYLIAAGVTSVNVPVQAVNAGVQGNVTAGSISLIQTGISGIDTVTNGSPFINGLDAESDASLRTRFVLYIQALARSTKGAIGYAITSLQSGLQYTITENQQYAGATDNGYMTIVVDDGSGAPSAALITAATNAVDAYRAATTRFGVFAPVVVNVTVSCTITTAAGYNHSTLVAQVAAAISSYINGLGLGNTLRWSRLEQVAYDVSPGITNVASLLVNSATSDVTASALQTIKCPVSPTVA